MEINDIKDEDMLDEGSLSKGAENVTSWLLVDNYRGFRICYFCFRCFIMILSSQYLWHSQVVETMLSVLASVGASFFSVM